MKQNEVFPNVEPTNDKVYRVLEAVSSLAPAGGLLFKSLVRSPLEKRLEKWINKVEIELQNLEDSKQITIIELSERPAFSALFLKSTQIVAMTSQEEKLNYLRNFIVNLSKKPTLSEDELYIILGAVEDFTPSHIKALKFFHEPSYFKEKIELFIRNRDAQSYGVCFELAAAFEEGSPSYWQSVFGMLVTKGVVMVKENSFDSENPELLVGAVVTEIGAKLISMIKDSNKKT